MGNHDMRHMEFIDKVAESDLRHIRHKESTYLGSWKKRGGQGVFMMFARKWDRIENMMNNPIREPDGEAAETSSQQNDRYDLFGYAEAEGFSTRDGSLLSEMQDLRTYLLLAEAELRARQHQAHHNVYLPEDDVLRRFADSGIAGVQDEPLEEDPCATTDHYDRVVEFMLAAGQEVPSEASIPDEQTRILRAKLIFEEAMETIEALGVSIYQVQVHTHLNRDAEFDFSADGTFSMVDAVDGCADLSVVNTGTLIALGVRDVSVLRTVDEANLNKFKNPTCPNCKTLTKDSADAQVPVIPGRIVCINCNEEYPAGYRSADGKWIKPHDFCAPDIGQVLEDQSQAMKGNADVNA